MSIFGRFKTRVQKDKTCLSCKRATCAIYDDVAHLKTTSHVKSISLNTKRNIVEIFLENGEAYLLEVHNIAKL